MGYFRHHAIVVTARDWGNDVIGEVHANALEYFSETSAHVTEMTEEGVNGFRSFMIAPDGGKEGWPTSNDAESAREKFLKYLRDDNIYVDWVEIEFGGDDEDIIRVQDSIGTMRRWESGDGFRAEASAH